MRAVLLAAVLTIPVLAPALAPTAAAWAPGRNDYAITMRDGTVIDATMMVPPGTPADAKLPAVILVHGYGGSKSVGDATQAMQRGYVGFAYSTRGFGRSTGQMDLVGPGSIGDLKELIAWLKVNGPVDPAKVAVVGCSYGGGHAMQIAAEPDAGIATAVPCATWSDLLLALYPNHVFKLSYTSGFYLTGNGLVQSGDQPVDQEVGGQQLGRRQLYDTYDPNIHAGYAASMSGLFTGNIEEFARERSAALKVANIKVPIFLIQGMNDDLFAADQVLTFFDLIPHQEKFLYLGYVGHPRAVQSGPEEQYARGLVFQWLDYYLKGIGAKPFDPALPIEVAKTPWDGSRVRIARFPGGGEGSGVALNADGSLGAPAPAGFGVLANTFAAGLGDDPVIPYASAEVGAVMAGAPQGTPVDTLAFRSKPLAQATELFGTPRLDLRLTPAGASFQVAAKIFDVSRSGEATLVTRGIYGVEDVAPGLPMRILLDLQPYRYTFAPDHHIEVRLAASDFPTYLPERGAFTLALNLGAGGSAITLPLSAALP